jgi:hypothetical protein
MNWITSILAMNKLSTVSYIIGRRGLGRAAAGCVLALSLAIAGAVGATHIRIAATADAMDSFENWVSTTPLDQIQNFANGNATRPVVDLILELKALKAGGLDFDYEFVRSLTYDLAKNDVIQGNADLAAETLWNDDITAHGQAFLNTDPVIRNGEFVKGIYVRPDDATLLKISSLPELQGSVGAVVATWALDLRCLRNMHLKNIVKAPTPDLLFGRIERGQADFILYEFSSKPDMSVSLGGVRLVPVPNCVAAIPGSRCWVVSSASPNAAEIFKALAAGTKILRANGTIERAYKECGFFNARVSGWKRIN